jgi:hypothetical protein
MVKCVKRLYVWIFTSVVIFSFNSLVVSAQRSHFSVFLSPVLPLSNLNDNANWGLISGNINYNLDLTGKLSWCLSAGYNKFGPKTVTVDLVTRAQYVSHLAYIPLTSGFQFFLNKDKLRFYLFAKGGYYLPAGDFIKSSWGISPGSGFQIPVPVNHMKIDISLIYNRVFGSTTKEFTANSIYGGSVNIQTSYSHISYIAINAGVTFGK